MKNNNYIVFILVMASIACISKAYGQVVPWTVTPTTNNQEIVLKNATTTANYDYKFDTDGDAIGVFFDQGGILVCGGYIILDGVTEKFTIYGNDAVDNGFQPGENYSLKYWRKDQNCIIDAPSAGMSNANYSNGGSDTIIVLGAWPAIVKYPSDYYCSYRTSGLPISLQITGTTFSNLSIATDPPVIFGYNAVTGDLENLSADPGTYTFNITTLDNKCLRFPSFDVTISPNLQLSPIIEVTQPDCKERTGRLYVDTSLFLKGTKPYELTLENESTLESYAVGSGEAFGLPAARYNLIVKDFYGCSDTSNVVVNEIKGINCDEISSILTPGQNNDFAEVFLPWEGELKIYNSQGNLVRSLQGPGIWNGTNNNGNVLNTGLYIIYSNNSKKKEITIVY